MQGMRARVSFRRSVRPPSRGNTRYASRGETSPVHRANDSVRVREPGSAQARDVWLAPSRRYSNPDASGANEGATRVRDGDALIRPRAARTRSLSDIE